MTIGPFRLTVPVGPPDPNVPGVQGDMCPGCGVVRMIPAFTCSTAGGRHAVWVCLLCEDL